MKAWHLTSSPGEYRWGEVATPEPGASEVRVRVVASALNHMDHWLTVARPAPRTLPHVPGGDVAGRIDAVGPGVGEWRVGDEVIVDPTVVSAAAADTGWDAPLDPSLEILGEHRWGGHGDYVVVPARNIVRKPPGRTWEECAALPVAGVTAWRMLRRARVVAGERVLVVGIGGGVSTAALMIARYLGAEVFATSRDAAKGRRAVELGATEVCDSGGEFPGGMDVVIESVGAATWDRSLGSLRRGGRLVVCGATSGGRVEVDLQRLFFRQWEIIGSTMGSGPEFADLVNAFEGGLGVVVDSVVPLESFPAVLSELRGGGQLGKIVLRHGEDLTP